MNRGRQAKLAAAGSGSVARAIRAIASTWLCAVIGLTATQAAQVDYFLKLDGIEGEATSTFHPKWIVVHSVNLGVSRSPGDSGPGFSLLTLDMPLNKATPRLMELCASNQIIATGRLEFIRQSDNLLLFCEMNLKGIRVEEVSGASTDDGIRHRVALTVSQIEMTYTAYDLADKPLSRPSMLWDIPNKQGEFSEKPLFRATVIHKKDGNLLLSWGATAARDYRVMAAGNVTGPYVEVQRYPSHTTGLASITLPFNPNNQFFLLEEVPQKP